jgi:hypothetical protein
MAEMLLTALDDLRRAHLKPKLLAQYRMTVAAKISHAANRFMMMERRRHGAADVVLAIFRSLALSASIANRQHRTNSPL